MTPYLPAVIKVRIIEYLCDCDCWINLQLFVTDVYHWLLAEPGLYRDVMMIDHFRKDILGEAWLKFLDERIYQMEISYLIHGIDEEMVEFIDIESDMENESNS
jgi:hypothetical protein